MLDNGQRALAHIEEIASLSPIEGADRIEVAQVLGWKVVVKKGEFQVGDKVVYIEIDSKVPASNPYFAFLQDRKYKVKTIKLRGQISQGLVVPVDVLPYGVYKIGDNVTEILGITKIEDRFRPRNERTSEEMRLRQSHPKLVRAKWFKKLMRYKWFRKFAFKCLISKKKSKFKDFPTGYEGVSKTDESRIENEPWILQDKSPFIVTTKIDGTSCTVLVDHTKRKEEVYVCSRNVRQARDSVNYHDNTGDDNVYWQAVDKYKLLDFLREAMFDYDVDWACIQGEIAGISEGGAKIQGDPHKFGELRFFGFNLILPEYGRIESVEAAQYAEACGVPWVPIVDTNYILPDTMEEFKEAAVGPCEAVGAHGQREGYVYRKVGEPTFSFKNINNKYLLKNDSY